MQERWWEGTARFVCDRWWLLLLLLTSGMALYLTSPFWLPATPQFASVPPTPSPAQSVSAPPSPAAQPTPLLGTGDVQITLIWNSENDLDLWVEDPQGVRIYYGAPSSPSGGQLDVDVNAACNNVVSQAVENIFWPHGGAPHGSYVILVNHYRQCTTQAPTPFTIRLLVDGQTWEFAGELISEGQTVEVYRFER